MADLPKWLEEKRDGMAHNAYESAISHYSGSTYKRKFIEGFNACAEILLEDHKRTTINSTSLIKYLMRENEDLKAKLEKAREALQEIDAQPMLPLTKDNYSEDEIPLVKVAREALKELGEE